MQARDAVESLQKSREFERSPHHNPPAPFFPGFLDEAMKTRKKYSIVLIKYFSTVNTRESKTSQRIYMLSCKHTYRPISARSISVLL